MMRRRPGPKPVEPLWPHGAIAQMVIIPADQSDTGQTTMGLRKLTVTNATKTAEGWRIVAQSPNRIVRFLDVDEEGIGDDCEPWTDELERDVGPADPEHNVVMLEQVQAPPRQAEVIDINAKWAERDEKIQKLDEGVNNLRRPAPTTREDEEATARTREFIRRVRAGIPPTAEQGSEGPAADLESGAVTAAMVRGVARASERREAKRKEEASRREEAEHHGNA